MKRISKTISVTISLEEYYGQKDKYWANIDFCESESGDTFGISSVVSGGNIDAYDEIRIGTELSSWLSLMADEMEESEV